MFRKDASLTLLLFANPTPLHPMQPSLYDQLPPDRRRKFVRYVLEFFVLAAVAFFLFQLEAQHWLLQILLGAILLRQVIVLVKLLNITTINPKKRPTPDDASPPTS